MHRDRCGEFLRRLRAVPVPGGSGAARMCVLALFDVEDAAGDTEISSDSSTAAHSCPSCAVACSKEPITPYAIVFAVPAEASVARRYYAELDEWIHAAKGGAAVTTITARGKRLSSHNASAPPMVFGRASSLSVSSKPPVSSLIPFPDRPSAAEVARRRAQQEEDEAAEELLDRRVRRLRRRVAKVEAFMRGLKGPDCVVVEGRRSRRQLRRNTQKSRKNANKRRSGSDSSAKSQQQRDADAFFAVGSSAAANRRSSSSSRRRRARSGSSTSSSDSSSFASEDDDDLMMSSYDGLDSTSSSSDASTLSAMTSDDDDDEAEGHSLAVADALSPSDGNQQRNLSSSPPQPPRDRPQQQQQQPLLFYGHGFAGHDAGRGLAYSAAVGRGAGDTSTESDAADEDEADAGAIMLSYINAVQRPRLITNNGRSANQQHYTFSPSASRHTTPMAHRHHDQHQQHYTDSSNILDISRSPKSGRPRLIVGSGATFDPATGKLVYPHNANSSSPSRRRENSTALLRPQPLVEPSAAAMALRGDRKGPDGDEGILPRGFGHPISHVDRRRRDHSNTSGGTNSNSTASPLTSKIAAAAARWPHGPNEGEGGVGRGEGDSTSDDGGFEGFAGHAPTTATGAGRRITIDAMSSQSTRGGAGGNNAHHEEVASSGGFRSSNGRRSTQKFTSPLGTAAAAADGGGGPMMMMMDSNGDTFGASAAARSSSAISDRVLPPRRGQSPQRGPQYEFNQKSNPLLRRRRGSRTPSPSASLTGSLGGATSAASLSRSAQSAGRRVVMVRVTRTPDGRVSKRVVQRSPSASSSAVFPVNGEQLAATSYFRAASPSANNNAAEQPQPPQWQQPRAAPRPSSAPRAGRRASGGGDTARDDAYATAYATGELRRPTPSVARERSSVRARGAEGTPAVLLSSTVASPKRASPTQWMNLSQDERHRRFATEDEPDATVRAQMIERERRRDEFLESRRRALDEGRRREKRDDGEVLRGGHRPPLGNASSSGAPPQSSVSISEAEEWRRRRVSMADTTDTVCGIGVGGGGRGAPPSDRPPPLDDAPRGRKDVAKDGNCAVM